MSLKFNRLWPRILRAEQGSISILGAITMLLMVLVVGIAIDSSRLVQSSAKLKALNDMAALAATEEPNKTVAERKAIFEKVMELGVARSDEISDFEYTLTVEDTPFLTTLKATSRSKAHLFFPSTSNEGLYVEAHSEIKVGKEDIEVALVLDISSSMNGARIAELKAAAKNFITVLMDNVEIRERITISIVPYGGTVRLPDGLENMLIPPVTDDHWIDGEWNGCLWMEADDYRAGIAPSDTHTYLPHFYVWRKSNPWCPNPGNEMVGLSNNADMLNAKIDALTLSDGTGTDVGAAWGYATLDPAWRGNMPGVGSEYPRDYNPSTRKIMIVMSDGGITGQYFPRDDQMYGSFPFHTKTVAIGRNVSKGGFEDICELSRSNGIQVYTIGFQMRNQSHKDSLKICASSENHHYEANVGELQGVFQNMAGAIAGLRISR